MATEAVDRSDELPDWLLAFGPFLVIGSILTLALGAMRFVDLGVIADASTVESLAIMTVVGFVAGILPVLVGMLWFPYVRRLETEWVHAVLAFSIGILAFIAYEMAAEAVGHALATSSVAVGGGVALVGALVTIVLMELASRWQHRKTAAIGGRGLVIAYLVAIGLGLHSVGEGLAIGAAFANQEAGLVILFTVGFLIHNVTEGPAVIAAIASERSTPPLRHFAALGVLAGGGVIVGGWIGTFATSSLFAATVFGIAFGAIVQVVWEMIGFVRADAGHLFNRRLAVAFLLGVALIFFLEDIVVEGWLGV